MSDVHSAPLPPGPRFYHGARLGLLALVATPFLAVAGWEWQFFGAAVTGLGTGHVEPTSQVPGIVLAASAVGTALSGTVLALADRRSVAPVLRVVVAALSGASALLLVVVTALQIVAVVHLATTTATDVPY